MLSGNLNFILRFIFLVSIALTVCYRVKFILLGRVEFSNYRSVSGYNLISKIRFISLISLVFLRVWFGFFYFTYFLDSPIIIDLSGFLKVIIITFLYYIYLFLDVYVRFKEVLHNKLVRRCRTLFFLRAQRVSVKNYVVEFV